METQYYHVFDETFNEKTQNYDKAQANHQNNEMSNNTLEGDFNLDLTNTTS